MGEEALRARVGGLVLRRIEEHGELCVRHGEAIHVERIEVHLATRGAHREGPAGDEHHLVAARVADRRRERDRRDLRGLELLVARGDRIEEPLAEDGARGRPLVRRLRERIEDQSLERRRHVGPELRGRSRRVGHVRHHHAEVTAVERRASGHQLVERDPERVDVRPVIGQARRLHLLRRHVPAGAEQRATHRVGRALEHLGDAEIGDLRAKAAAVVPDEDVVGLEVAMDDPVRVGVIHREEDVADDGPDLVERHLPAPASEVLREVLALDELHHDREHVLVLDEVVDPDRARMAPRAKDPRLADEAPPHLGVAGEVHVEALEGDVAAERHVPRTVDDAHTPFSDHGLDAVDGERRPRGEAHRREAAGDPSAGHGRFGELGGGELGVRACVDLFGGGGVGCRQRLPARMTEARSRRERRPAGRAHALRGLRHRAHSTPAAPRWWSTRGSSSRVRMTRAGSLELVSRSGGGVPRSPRGSCGGSRAGPRSRSAPSRR